MAGSEPGPDALGDAGGLADVLADPSGVAGVEEMAGLDGAELDAAGDDLTPAAAPTCAAGVSLAPKTALGQCASQPARASAATAPTALVTIVTAGRLTPRRSPCDPPRRVW
ncbi:MAG TPA: hypothetical protein VHU92_05465 [Streptosporangiaceae bacterium]|nr:hypothetical protein [Streptosporangiaceae bacterium]